MKKGFLVLFVLLSVPVFAKDDLDPLAGEFERVQQRYLDVAARMREACGQQQPKVHMAVLHGLSKLRDKIEAVVLAIPEDLRFSCEVASLMSKNAWIVNASECKKAWPKVLKVPEVLAAIEAARAAGIEVRYDAESYKIEGSVDKFQIRGVTPDPRVERALRLSVTYNFGSRRYNVRPFSIASQQLGAVCTDAGWKDDTPIEATFEDVPPLSERVERVLRL